MAETNIPWCRYTWNIWLGCDDHDADGNMRPGCVHCYARNGAAKRGWDVWGLGKPRRRTSVAYWKHPVKWNADALAAGARERVFLGSYMDFADGDPSQVHLLDQWRADACEVIEKTPALDYLILSKRFDRLFGCMPPHWQRDGLPPNVWLILSAVTQAEVDAAATALAAIPVYVAVRGLSLEPLVEQVHVRRHVRHANSCRCPACFDSVQGALLARHGLLDWLIIGGESQSSRVFSPSWIDSVQGDLAGSDCQLFVKQYGTRMARTLGLVKDDFKLEDLAHMEPRHRVRQYPTGHIQAA